jgi:hypothetical protein
MSLGGRVISAGLMTFDGRPPGEKNPPCAGPGQFRRLSRHFTEPPSRNLGLVAGQSDRPPPFDSRGAPGGIPLPPCDLSSLNARIQ